MAGRQAYSPGVTEQTINWATDYRERKSESEPALESSERARLQKLEKENQELRAKCEFLSEVAMYLAAEHR